MRSDVVCQPPVKKLRLVVADDNPAFLKTLFSLLELEFDIVATATDGQSALNQIRTERPDVVVLDLYMPGLNGIEITEELARHPPSPPVVICSSESDAEIVAAARQAGATAYVFKSRIGTALIDAVKSAAGLRAP